MIDVSSPASLVVLALAALVVAGSVVLAKARRDRTGTRGDTAPHAAASPQSPTVSEPSEPSPEDLLAAYLTLVETTARQLCVDASALPAPKARLHAILRDALQGNVETTASRETLRGAWMRLATFQPGPLDLPAPGEVPNAWTSLAPDELRALLITVRNDAVADLLIRVEIEEKRLASELARLEAATTAPR